MIRMMRSDSLIGICRIDVTTHSAKYGAYLKGSGVNFNSIASQMQLSAEKYAVNEGYTLVTSLEHPPTAPSALVPCFA